MFLFLVLFLLAPAAAQAGQINLSWIDNVTGETGFEIERASDTTTPRTLLTTTPAGATTFSDTDPMVGPNFYRIRGVNAGVTPPAYTGWSVWTSATVPPISGTVQNPAAVYVP